MFLFFDTETTGLPKNWKRPHTDTDNWPRMVQIAWLLFDLKGKQLDSKNYIIKPDGYTIPKEVSMIHGITTSRAENEGHDLIQVLTEFSEYINESEYMVAHNMSFDEKIAGAEFVRKNVPNKLFVKKRFCTMLSSTDICKIPGPYGYKWPKLAELHYKLFREDFDDAHDASVDISITAKCFWEMKKRKLI
jgi:DNA polymerase III subunit epsilon